MPPASSDIDSTLCKEHTDISKKEKKSTVKANSHASSHKTLAPVSIKGHAPKHKATAANNTSSQQTDNPPKQLTPKPLDFKQLMKIASEQNGNRSKELVKQALSSHKKSTVSQTQVKTPAPKAIKRAEQACINQPKSSLPPKQVSANHKGLVNDRSTSNVLPQQKSLLTTTTKKPVGIGNKVETKAPSVKLKTSSFYQSSAIGSNWSDMKKTIRKPQLQKRHNGFNISGSWINELGLTRLPTDLDSDYEDDDDLSDFVASDDEGVDEGNAEDYSAAIRDIFGYDRRK